MNVLDPSLRAGLEHLPRYWATLIQRPGGSAEQYVRWADVADLLRAQPPDLKEPASWIDRWWEEHEGRLSAMRELRASQEQYEAAFRLVRMFYEKIGEHARVGVLGNIWLDAKVLVEAGRAQQPPPAPAPLKESALREARESLDLLLRYAKLSHAYDLVYHHRRVADMLLPSAAPPAVEPPPAPDPHDGECNPYASRCGALFCTYEAMAQHEKICNRAALPAVERTKKQP